MWHWLNIINGDPVSTTGCHLILILCSLLLDHGIAEDHILYICVIASAPGLQEILTKHPKMHIAVGMVDNILTASGLILPGLGVYGDRYFGTEQDGNDSDFELTEK